MRVVQVGYLKLTCSEEDLPILLGTLCRCEEVETTYDGDYIIYINSTKPTSFEVSDYPVGSQKKEETTDA